MRKRIAAGSVFQRTYRDRNGVHRKTHTWFLKYYVNGKPLVVPSRTEDYSEAVSMLRQRIAKAARFAEYSSEPEHVLVDQLLDLVIEDYRFHRRNSTYDAEHRIQKHLRPAFGQKKAGVLTTTAITR
jgi:hypothetical protein